MMHKMRENTKIILWVVVVAFVVTIFAVWGLDLRTGHDSSDPNLIGRVNGVPVSRFQYQASYDALANQFRAGSGEPLTYAQEDFVASQAWDNIVFAIVTDQQIEKLGITVNNEEIVSYLRNSPPPEIRQYFLDDDGNFDNNAYQTALNNPQIDWTNLEQLARERIPRLKLQNYLAAQVFVSEEDVRLAYESQVTEMSIAYVEYAIDDVEVKDFSPTQAEIESYYTSHREEFVEPAKARVDAVRFELKPSAADVEDVAYTADRVHDQILGGEDFGVLAKTYSEAATSHVEGNTGFIRRGQRESAYFDALEGLSPGEVSAPVAAENGYYVLKLIETKIEDGQKQYNVQEILVKTSTGRETVDSLYSALAELRDRARTVGLDAAAAEKEIPLLTPEPFTEGAPVGILGFVPALNRFAFANDVGALSPVLRDEKHVYLARVLDRIPESLRPLDQVTESIRHRLLFEAKRQAAEREATAFYRKAVASSFEHAARTYGKTVEQSATFKAFENLASFDTNSPVAQAALRTDAGKVAPPVQSRRSFVVLRVLQKSPFNEAEFRAASPQIRDQIEMQKVQSYSGFWFEKMKKESVIEDYRDRVS
jgi:parvulin-like peptidyl-prolyl isomerase